MNYIKQYKDGTTEATLVKPSYGVVSTTGDYLIDGLWYDLTGTLYTTQFTYLSKDGKLLGIEVVDGEPVDIHYDEDAPSIVEDCIQADTLILGNESITGVLGQGQTWQDVTDSRGVGIVYTNDTGKPIQISISITGSGGGYDAIQVSEDGIDFVIAGGGNPGAYNMPNQVIIPDKHMYKTIDAFVIWSELR